MSYDDADCDRDLPNKTPIASDDDDDELGVMCEICGLALYPEDDFYLCQQCLWEVNHTEGTL